MGRNQRDIRCAVFVQSRQAGQAVRKAKVTLLALPSDPSMLHRWEKGIRKAEKRAAGGACQYSVLLR